MADGTSIACGYDRPSRLDDALALLAERPRVVLAGGTDLYPATTARALKGDVLDITGIHALRGVTRTADGWRIGSATTWTDLIRSDLPAAFDALKEAAREVGSVQIQNAGTLGGNLCNASPAADGAPVLMALDAEVELASAGMTRAVPLSDFLTGPRQTVLGPGEILTAILIPDAAGDGFSAFAKLGARRYLVISIAMAAVRLVACEDSVTAARVAVGSCSATARRIAALEDVLTGGPLASAAERVTPDMVAPALAPIDDIRGSASYRSEAATRLVAEAVARAAKRAAEQAS